MNEGAHRQLAAWPGLFVAPIAFFVNLFITYPLVPWVCGNQHHGVLHAVDAIFLAVALFGVWHAARVWRARQAPIRSDAGDHASQQHFLGVTGTLASAIFALALAAQWLTAFIVPPCMG